MDSTQNAYFTVRKRLEDGYVALLRALRGGSATFHAWVVLGLIAISVGVSLLEVLVGFWLAGLIFVQVFTGLGVEERAARLRSEELIKELTEVQGQLRAYAVRAEELATIRERTRVAREIHDTLAQGLAAIKMLLETGGAVFPERPELARQHMERARTLAGEHLHQARTSILALRSDALGGQPLSVALSVLAAA
ncbi:MAG: histidine kinase [Ktedonobacteraceae bacterium]|nr:histidine kinase [Chloroflexota bacterium]